MKKSIINSIVLATTALLIFGTSMQETKGQSQMVSTILQNGILVPIVELSEVRVSAAGFKKQIAQPKASQLTLTNTAQIVKVEFHSGEYMPSVLMNEATVVANASKASSASGLTKALTFVIGFISNYVSHYGIIQ